MTIKYGRVTSAGAKGYGVTFLGETEESQKQYKRLATYTPIVGDMVAFVYDGKKYLCLGKVI